MKTLFLNGGEVFLDDEDFEKLPKTGWWIHSQGNSRTCYAEHEIYGKMYRYILNITDPNVCIDHINRNGLDNRCSNLRITNTQINKRNQNTCSNNKFNFNGIAYEPPKGNRSGRIRVTWSEYEYLGEQKRNKRKSKSFSLSRHTKEEAIRQGILIRIAKMREFGYVLDERSETIERQIIENQLPIEEILGIDLSFVE